MSKKNDKVSANQKVIGSGMYKGRKYIILWSGVSKNGTRRMLLGAYNGAFKFFVDEDKVTNVKFYRRSMLFKDLQRLMHGDRDDREVISCDECGRRTSNFYEATDSSGIPGRVCATCANMSPAERSFA